jgi:P27 family predicted phage terminase small subunit
MANGGRRPRAGRKPKPVSEHVRDGTFRPDRHGSQEPAIREADGRRPPMPQGFSAREKTAWKRLLDGLAAESLLDHADAPLYEAFAVQWARMKEARAAVHKHGLLLTNAQGVLVANPAVRMERDAVDRVRQLADQLAIGLHTRSSLSLAVARGRAVEADGAAPASAAGAELIGPSPRLRAVT